jgi:AcrR family transcriptional regulator
VTTQQQWPARTAARERTRAALLAATEQLALQTGYAGTSLEAVASAAGVTTGAIYSIFGSKRDLFLEVFTTLFPEPRFTDLVAPGVPMAQGLRDYGRAWAERFSDERAFAVYDIGLEMLVALRSEPEVRRQMLAQHAPNTQQLADDLTLRARQSKEKLPLPALELATAIRACLSGLMNERVHTGKPSNAVFGYVVGALWGAS